MSLFHMKKLKKHMKSLIQATIRLPDMFNQVWGTPLMDMELNYLKNSLQRIQKIDQIKQYRKIFNFKQYIFIISYINMYFNF